ncbi:LysR family transcriptional regulator [Desulfovibrio sp. JC010]|uniref:LysR family transcriptional regulator n=1 Tax=Desulfovibrio sp. JC010 TaxID=2593641 RepID=UPI0013D365CD|nr:LysR family transcriptional regulator [Desulfovibrio sp. JC010]NDV28619.1 LysR family transcriptional regulator [Desulfovibrio sp. JC010]
MRMRQLRYFIAVAEELHFGKAAERLHIQQPPLSRQIQNMEEELDVQLFKRTNRKVELTDEGSYFLQEAKEMLAIMDRSRTTLQAMGDGTAGKLQISFIYLALSSSFPQIIGDFIKQYPDVDVSLYDENTYSQVNAVKEGTRHVGFVTMNLVDTKGLESMTVHKSTTCAAIPASHPLAEKDVLTLKDISALPYICSTDSYCRMRVKEMQRIFAQRDLELKIGMQYERKHTGNVFVAAGLGWTVINTDSTGTIPDGIALKPLEIELHPFEIGMIWNAERITPLVRNFIEFYRERVDE